MPKDAIVLVNWLLVIGRFEEFSLACCFLNAE